MLLLIAEAPPKEVILILAMLLLSGISEGLGIATFLPLFSSISDHTLGEGSSNGVAQAMLGWISAHVGFTPGMGTLLGAVVLMFWLKAALVVGARTRMGTASAQFATQLRSELLDALARARWDYFKRKPVGELANAMTTEITKTAVTQSHSFDITSSLLQIAVYLTVALLISWKLTLVALVMSALVWLPLHRFVWLARHAGRVQRDSYHAVVRGLVDNLIGVKAIKAMAVEDRFTPMLAGDNQALFSGLRLLVMSNAFVQGLSEPILVTLMAIIGYAAFSLLGTDFASLLVVAMTLYRLAATTFKFQVQYQGLVSAEPFVQAVLRELNEAVAAREVRHEGKQPAFRKSIKIRGLTFAFDGHPVLQGVDMDIEAGRLTVLHGPSGSGKTTLMDLVIGLYQPSGGSIEIDGVPLAEHDIMAWRHQVGYVPQESLLFNDTVLANVTLRDSALTDTDAILALKQAGAWEFVEPMPEGLRTPMGERAQRLSGGQRQRLAIARALVRKPKLLILDEPTTALDPEAEARVCQTLRELADDMTVFVVSHQPAILAVADRAYRISNGRVAIDDDPMPAARFAAGGRTT